jgi:predicted amidohydrolase
VSARGLWRPTDSGDHARPVDGKSRVERHANRTGREAAGQVEVEFRGESQVVDCDGTLLKSAGRAPATLVVDVDLSRADLKANAMCADLNAEWQRYQPRIM